MQECSGRSNRSPLLEVVLTRLLGQFTDRWLQYQDKHGNLRFPLRWLGSLEGQDSSGFLERFTITSIGPLFTFFPLKFLLLSRDNFLKWIFLGSGPRIETKLTVSLVHVLRKRLQSFSDLERSTEGEK